MLLYFSIVNFEGKCIKNIFPAKKKRDFIQKERQSKKFN